MEINIGMNIGNIFSLNNSKDIPVAEIVELECYLFRDTSEINNISNCLKSLNTNYGCGGIVFLFRTKKNINLLNKRFYISGFKSYIFKEKETINILKQFNKKDLVNSIDDSTTQRINNNDDLMQFGFLWFFNEDNSSDNPNKIYLEAYFSIDDIHKSYLVSDEIYISDDNKFISENTNISIEDRNVYNCIL